MLARRLGGILPPMEMEERLEATKVHSVCGLLPRDAGLLPSRPFRAPHHTSSHAALVGGGSLPRPGEVSLAQGLDHESRCYASTLETQDRVEALAAFAVVAEMLDENHALFRHLFELEEPAYEASSAADVLAWAEAYVAGYGVEPERAPRAGLYRNDGEWRFVEVGAEAGVDHAGWGMGVSVADFNADGHADLVIGSPYKEGVAGYIFAALSDYSYYQILLQFEAASKFFHSTLKFFSVAR